MLIIDPVVRQWGTYYGGTGDDRGYSCATDASGNIYLSGWTRSTSGIATTGAHQTTNGGSLDAFLVKFNDLKNVGLANSLKAIGIKVYPNPTSEELNITIVNKFLGSTYKILDPIGKKVLDGKINNTNTTIDVSALSKGYYLLQIGDGTVSYKFIVQ